MYSSAEIIENDTVGDLLDSLDEMVEDGRYSASSIVPLKIAVRKIMRETEKASNNWEVVPLSKIDLDKRIALFKSTTDSCSDGTIRAYKMRFERAVKLHLAEARKNRRRQEALESYCQYPMHIKFGNLNDFSEVKRPKSVSLFTTTDSDENSKITRALQNEYAIHFKKELMRFVNTTNFEETNMILPVSLENDDVFLVLPKDLPQEKKELLLKKIRLLLDYSD